MTKVGKSARHTGLRTTAGRLSHCACVRASVQYHTKHIVSARHNVLRALAQRLVAVRAPARSPNINTRTDPCAKPTNETDKFVRAFARRPYNCDEPAPIANACATLRGKCTQRPSVRAVFVLVAEPLLRKSLQAPATQTPLVSTRRHQ